MTIPALLLCYSRYLNLIPTIVELENQGVKKFYIAIDGQKNSQSNVSNHFDNEIKKLKQRSKSELIILKRPHNLGTSAAIISSLDWFFAKEEEGLIIEDDLIISKSFVEFCVAALAEYQNFERIWLVSGNQLFEREELSYSNEFSTFPLIWGWATTRNKWVEMREAMLSDPGLIKIKHDRRCQEFWRAGSRRALAGVVDSWAILLASQMHSLRKYCVLPTVNLVSNVGVDEHAVHTQLVGWPHNLAVEVIKKPFKFAPMIESSEIATVDFMLESQLYKIRWRHILLPIKTFFQILLNGRNQAQKLSSRLLNAKESYDE